MKGLLDDASVPIQAYQAKELLWVFNQWGEGMAFEPQHSLRRFISNMLPWLTGVVVRKYHVLYEKDREEWLVLNREDVLYNIRRWL